MYHINRSFFVSVPHAAWERCEYSITCKHVYIGTSGPFPRSLCRCSMEFDAALMSQSWEGRLYHSLIKRSSHLLDGGITTALHLYQEMARLASSDITHRTFELMLRLAHKKEHLNTYLTVSVINFRRENY